MSLCAFTTAKFVGPQSLHLAPSRLMEHLRDTSSRVVWVHGAPGSGKTTLAASFAKAAARPVVWLRVDPSDSDPAVLVPALGEALHQAGVVDMKTLPRFRGDHLGNFSGFLRGFLRAAFSNCDRLPLVVLDELEALDSESLLGDLLQSFVSHVPTELRTVALSRRAPPPALMRHMLNGDVYVLSPKALRLNREEIGEVIYAKTSKKAPPSSKELDAMLAQTGGWLTGVLLWKGTDQSTSIVEDGTAGDGPIQLAPYFDSEVLSGLDEHALRGLYQVAWLPSLDRKTVSDFAASDNPIHALEFLADAGLFVERVRWNDTFAYTIHPLLARHLRTRAIGELTPRNAEDIRRRSARWMEQSDWPLSALELWHALGDVDAVCRVVRNNASDFFANGGVLTLARWLRALPTSVIHDDPSLLYWRGLVALQRDPQAARQDLVAAANAFKLSGQRRAWLTTLSHLSSSYFLERANAKATIELISEVDGLAQEFEVFEESDDQALIAVCVWMGMFLHEPDHPDLELWEDRLQRLIQARVNPSIQVRAAMVLTKHYYFTGQYDKISPLAALVAPATNDPQLTPYARQLWSLIALADAWTHGNYDRASAVYQTSMAYANESGVTVMNLFLKFYAGIASLLRGEHQEVQARLDEIETNLSAARPMEVWSAFLLKTWTAYAQGNASLSVEHGQVALAAAVGMQAVAFEGLAHVGLAYAVLELGDQTRFETHLASIQCLEQRGGGALLTFHRLVLNALRELRQNDRAAADDCRAALVKAMRCGRQHNLLHFLLANEKPLALLCAHALEHGIEVDYATRLARARRLTPPVLDSVSEQWPWPFRIYTLGRWCIEKDGTPIIFKGKSQQRPLAILKCLIANGGAGVSPERLADELWPDADGDHARHAFETALYRLRKLLGRSDSVRLSNGELSLNPDHFWIDIDYVEQQCRASNFSWANAPHAASLCRGTFLEHDNLRSVETRRHRFEGLMRRLETDETTATELGIPAYSASHL
ncbi:MAG: AAA family ATPase [Gammaproteobacteria bacterium]|nr:AAA family ATPase [Gammaproteobacteria bacterium]